MNVYKAKFEGMWPIGNCLIIKAESMRHAMKIAKETVTHTEVDEVEQVSMDEEGVIEYLSGDY